MDIVSAVERNYDIGSVNKVVKTEYGSGNTFIVHTHTAKYIAKFNNRNEHIAIYDKIQNVLNKNGIKQSRIIKTKAKTLMTSEGMTLYEFIEGQTYECLTELQLMNAFKYLKKYNKALSEVAFKESDLPCINHWDKAQSIDFIINDFVDLLSKINLRSVDKEYIYYAQNILRVNKNKINSLKKQLIHSDLGADNFIYDGDEVIAIIDFTPEYENEIYSICQFVYWNYLWEKVLYSKEDMDRFLHMYDDSEQGNETIYYLFLLKSILFRIVGPLLEKIHNSDHHYKGLEKRFLILINLLSLKKQYL